MISSPASQEKIISGADKNNLPKSSQNFFQVNNAGIMICKDFLSLSETDIRRTMEINAISHFWVRTCHMTPGCVRAGVCVVRVARGARGAHMYVRPSVVGDSVHACAGMHACAYVTGC